MAPREEEDALELEGPLSTRVRARGPGAMLALLIVVCFSGTASLIWAHHQDEKSQHQEEKASVDDLKNSVSEMVYVLSLPQEQREKLRLTMPESLRSKVRRSRDND